MRFISLKRPSVLTDFFSNCVEKHCFLEGKRRNTFSLTRRCSRLTRSVKITVKSILILLGIGSSLQATQVVYDPTTSANVMQSVTQLGTLVNVTNSVNSRMQDMNSCLGTNLTNPLMSLLSVFGKCSDPFGDMKNSLLGFSKIRPNLDFCNLVSAAGAYSALLFPPVTPQEFSFEKQQEVLQTRQNLVKEAAVNILALAGQQRKDAGDAQKRIEALKRKAVSSTNLRQDQMITNELLVVIASEILNLRLMMVNQSEIQASLAANQVPLAFNPSLQNRAGK